MDTLPQLPLTDALLCALLEEGAIEPTLASPLKLTVEGDASPEQLVEALSLMSACGMREPHSSETGERLWLALEALAQPEHLLHVRERTALGQPLDTVCGIREGVYGAAQLTVVGPLLTPAIDRETLSKALSRAWGGPANDGRVPLVVPRAFVDLATALWAGAGLDVKVEVSLDGVPEGLAAQVRAHEAALATVIEIKGGSVSLARPVRHALRALWTGPRLEVECLESEWVNASKEERAQSLAELCVVGEEGGRYLVSTSSSADVETAPDCIFFVPLTPEALESELEALLP